MIPDQTFQTERVLIWPSPDHGPDSNSDQCPDLNQTMIRPNFRLKYSLIRLSRGHLPSWPLWSKTVKIAIISPLVHYPKHLHSPTSSPCRVELPSHLAFFSTLTLWSILRLRWSWSDPSALEEVMIRPNCARSRFWSDPSALEEVIIRPNCARIRLWSDFSVQIYLWSDHLQTMIQTVVRSNFHPDPIISVWEHTCVRSTGSDHKSIWVWTSNWDTTHRNEQI